MTKRLKEIVTIILFILPFNLAFAMSLQEAKSNNLVGEKSNGYLGTVGQTTSEVRDLVEEINSKRKAEYQRIANSTGSSISDVEKLAGQKAIQDTQPGRYIKNSDQGWSLK